MRITSRLSHLFFSNTTAPTEIYTLSLHDALPISDLSARTSVRSPNEISNRDSGANLSPVRCTRYVDIPDRKSTRLNSSHVEISYAVFCLKKKKIYRE